MWLGQLFSVFALGARFQATIQAAENASSQNQLAGLWAARTEYYREKTVQCLVGANYTKCPPYTVETLLMYFGMEFLRSTDTQFHVFILVGIIIRVAFRMGYHREPSKFTNISPFRGEMRRRTWMLIVSLDLITSGQVGLPRMIQPFMYDTEEPRNLLESDLYEDMVELPPSRPEIELTPLLYTISLNRVRAVNAKIMDLMHTTTQPPPYREIMELDGVLRHVYFRTAGSPQTTSCTEFELLMTLATMRRVYLKVSFLKAALMLHRPYLMIARTDARYEYSRHVCLNAAYEMLAFQRKLDAEIQPGGKLWSTGWRVITMSWYLSSIAANDFLLATTVLIADLDEELSAPMLPAQEYDPEGSRLDRAPPTREAIISALQAAHKIWVNASLRSNEARKVAAAASIVLTKAGAFNENLEGYGGGKSPKGLSALVHKVKLTWRWRW